jgi:type VI secretion system secreted protein Hcp
VTQILVYLKGATQGELKADPGLADRAGTVPAHLFSTDEFFFSVETPRDSQSGLPTGKRVYVPVTFLKANGPSTPQLYQALATNEALTTVVFDCYGQAGLAHSVTLTNASVASMDFFHPDLRDPKTQNQSDCTQLALTFQKIEVVHGSISAADQW